MHKKTKHVKSLLIAFGGSAVLAGAPASAQTPPAELQRVEITGSNIRRVQSETAAPVQTLTREDIDRSGKASVAELLQTLAVDNQGSVPTTFGNGFASGASGISLRGLGASSTLVLVNGRRVAPYGLADDGQKVFADLNMIPLEAVERVEILKDGGSAIYGSDAIAGVVNIILKKDFKGAVAKVSYGRSSDGDGIEKRASITTGFGDLDKDKYNILFNFEVARKGEINNIDRAGRAQIGRGDLRDLGFSAQQDLGGYGAILANNSANSAINGNVRKPEDPLNLSDPRKFDYFNRGNLAGVGFTRTFPNAACANFTSHPQGDPGGGCLIDARQVYGQVQPSQESLNFFTRGTLQLTADLQGYVEVNVYNNQSVSSTTPSGVSASVGYPGGPVSNAAAALGASHPDNPYFGTAARLRYLAVDVGPRVNNLDSTFTRFVAGVKGTVQDWDIDSAVLFSQNKTSNENTGYLQRDVMFALLNPNGHNVIGQPTLANAAYAATTSAAYAALPAGSFWRIAENAGLNSAALYAALSPRLMTNAVAQTSQIDFKASRELGSLPGGAIGVAVGTEFRHESVLLDPTPGTDHGNIIGLGYSAYNGQRNLVAAYAELVAPVLKTLELSAAVRADHYSDVGNSITPKLGAKWTPLPEFALRGTYSEGFRAPNPAENGKGGLASFDTATDPLRCALGVVTACSSAPMAIIVSPNPLLQPEKSASFTLGFVWDPAPKTSISVDFFQIIRKNEINQEEVASAIAKGHVARDLSSAQAGLANDPGPIEAVLVNYVNSTQSTVRGVDVDARQGFDLGGWGKLTADAKWTHLFTLARTETDGSTHDFAGTHGNCDVTNCMGTPADRVNLAATWERGGLKVSTLLNYRASLDNRLYKGAPDCASQFADGTDAPAGCRIASFTTVDLSLRWKATEKLEVSGGVQNVLNRIAPLDTLTNGAVSYNPLDYSGAVGRFFSVGAKYRF